MSRRRFNRFGFHGRAPEDRLTPPPRPPMVGEVIELLEVSFSSPGRGGWYLGTVTAVSSLMVEARVGSDVVVRYLGDHGKVWRYPAPTGAIVHDENGDPVEVPRAQVPQVSEDLL